MQMNLHNFLHMFGLQLAITGLLVVQDRLAYVCFEHNMGQGTNMLFLLKISFELCTNSILTLMERYHLSDQAMK